MKTPNKHFFVASLSVVGFLSVKVIWKFISDKYKKSENDYIGSYMKIRSRYHITKYQFYRYHLPLFGGNIMYLIFSNNTSWLFRSKKNKLQITIKQPKLNAQLLRWIFVGFCNAVICALLDTFMNRHKISSPMESFRKDVMNDFQFYKRKVSSILNDFFIKYANKSDYKSIHGSKLGIELSQMIWDYIPINSHNIANMKYVDQHIKEHLHEIKFNSKNDNNTTNEPDFDERIPDFMYFWGHQICGLWIHKRTQKDLIDNILNCFTWWSINFGWINFFNIHKILHPNILSHYVKMVLFRELHVIVSGAFMFPILSIQDFLFFTGILQDNGFTDSYHHFWSKVDQFLLLDDV